MRRDGARKTLAREDRGAETGDHRPQPADVGIVCEQFERVVQARACLQQQRKIARERCHLRRTWPAEKAEAILRGRSLLVLNGFDRQQTKIFDTAGDFGNRRRRERAVHDFAVLRQGPVTKIRHDLDLTAQW